MYQELINHNQDLKHLQNDGYEIEIRDKHILISNIPYLNSKRQLNYGLLVSTLNFSGNKVLEPETHTAYFKGERPCNIDGSYISGIINSQIDKNIAGINCNFYLSGKPNRGKYKDYYEKITNYINIISAPAISLHTNVSAKTYKKIISHENSNLVYEDTNTSRAGIDNINNKILNQKIGIIGLGGTGSYLLDHIAKTPVAEIHLYDGDNFYQHNAFRAPGAPTFKSLSRNIKKVIYFKRIYSKMHKGIKAHSIYISSNNIKKLLKNLDFIFLNIDDGASKKIIIDFLIKNKIPFIDTGIDIKEVENNLIGSVRVTYCNDNKDIVSRISFNDENDDVYSTNIQISELNSLAAIKAMIKWKKINKIYLDNNNKNNLVYDTNDGEIKYEN